RSARVPTMGASIATAIVVAVIVNPTSTFEALKVFDSNGNSGCGAYRLRNAENPTKVAAERSRNVNLASPVAGVDPAYCAVLILSRQGDSIPQHSQFVMFDWLW